MVIRNAVKHKTPQQATHRTLIRWALLISQGCILSLQDSASRFNSSSIELVVHHLKSAMVEASIYFLKRDNLHHHEKPYAFRYEINSEEIPQSNMRMEKRDNIPIMDLRDSDHEISLEANGFTVMHLESALQYEDFFDEEKVQTYFRELEYLLVMHLGARSVEVFRHGVLFGELSKY